MTIRPRVVASATALLCARRSWILVWTDQPHYCSSFNSQICPIFQMKRYQGEWKPGKVKWWHWILALAFVNLNRPLQTSDCCSDLLLKLDQNMRKYNAAWDKDEVKNARCICDSFLSGVEWGAHWNQAELLRLIGGETKCETQLSSADESVSSILFTPGRALDQDGMMIRRGGVRSEEEKMMFVEKEVEESWVAEECQGKE